MIPIPFIDQNSFIIEASLDDTTYFLRFDWNSEAQLWTMAIQDARSEAVLQGVVLVPNTPLLDQFRHLAVPRGEFVVYAQDDNLQIGRDTLLTQSATLYYLTEAEVAALQS
ncbi:hypothetical protein CSC67_08715 [Pusillimonas caeni]|uniref:phage baseplate plug family protein n=1 Tax=Pusillimonas caeni TaxID=1348472 RepID=UPI000E59CE81|nr:hypothetical protein [Pusillimonas caeni]TFL14224.1 hypothetical protein CSC67_08715 [Pusillimonas caeni]